MLRFIWFPQVLRMKVGQDAEIFAQPAILLYNAKVSAAAAAVSDLKPVPAINQHKKRDGSLPVASISSHADLAADFHASYSMDIVASQLADIKSLIYVQLHL